MQLKNNFQKKNPFSYKNCHLTNIDQVKCYNCSMLQGEVRSEFIVDNFISTCIIKKYAQIVVTNGNYRILDILRVTLLSNLY